MGKYVQLVDNYPLYEQQYYHRLYTRQRRTTLMHAMRGVRHQVRMCMLRMGGGCYATVYGQDFTPAKGAQPARSAHNLGEADITSQSDITCAQRTKLKI
jgi:hypothetical protein